MADTKIQLRRATAAVAAANNVVLDVGEFGVETDTAKIKIGDGVTPWNGLPYFTPTGLGNVDGGRPDSVYTISQMINGGSP